MGKNLRKQTFLGNCLFSPYTNNNSNTNKKAKENEKFTGLLKILRQELVNLIKKIKLKTFDTEESWSGLEYLVCKQFYISF